MPLPARLLSRRQMLRASAGSLLAAGLWPGRSHADDAPGEFTFVAINDTHYLNDKCGPWFEAVTRSVKKHAGKAAFVLAVGDLANDGTAAQLGAALDVLKGFGLPYYAAVGNHDYKAQDDRKAYDELFPGRLNYRFDHGGWQFVCIDSTDGVRYDKTAVGAAALKWLDAEVPKLDAKRPTVLFTHFPLGAGVKYRVTNADAVLERFKAVNLRAVLNGHYHGFTEKKAGDAVVTTNRCCAFARNNHDGTKEKGYFLCTAKNGKLTREFVEVKPAG
jgi:3',5'-cyclic AMP phosphodiesterase CpdA